MDFLVDDEDLSKEYQHEALQDTAVWCEQCGVHNIGGCFVHGGHMTVTPDNALPTKARLSLPKILAIKRVRDPEPCSLEAKRGVFSKKAIKLRTLFGPMEAKRTQTRPKLLTGLMEYQIQNSDNTSEYLDISDENHCNWMMFVRPASMFSDQNMAAFQENGNIFFVTCKNIAKGTELRVWYTAAYAKAMDKRLILPSESEKKLLLPVAKKDNKTRELKQQQVTLDVQLIDALPVVTDVCHGSNAGSSQDTSSSLPQVISDKTLSRSVRCSQDLADLYVCSTCNTSFSRLSQSQLHVCKALGEAEEDSQASSTRRRKGRPKKFLDNRENPVTENAVSVKLDALATTKQEVESENVVGLRQNNTHLFPDNVDLSHREEPLQNCMNTDGGVSADLQVLPSPTILSTTAHCYGSDKKLAPPVVRKRGRPKGRKNNKTLAVIEKPLTKSSRRPTYTCKFCSQLFTIQEQHIVHEASHTNSLPYLCDFPGCSKSFNSKFKHQRHQIVHRKPNNFVCKFCPSTFNRVDHLKNHLLVHDSNRNTFTCHICGKSYLYKSNLTFHMAKHEATEGNSLQCLVCSASFESKEVLKRHINVHNRYKRESDRSVRPSCPQCHKLFSASKELRRHMVTHSKDRHFLCEHCPQTFVRKDHLRRHYTSNHKQEFYESQLKDSPFGCLMCLLVFKKKEFLDYHMKSVHPHGIPSPEDKGARREGMVAKGSAKTLVQNQGADQCSSSLLKLIMNQEQPIPDSECSQQLTQGLPSAQPQPQLVPLSQPSQPVFQQSLLPVAQQPVLVSQQSLLPVAQQPVLVSQPPIHHQQVVSSAQLSVKQEAVTPAPYTIIYPTDQPISQPGHTVLYDPDLVVAAAPSTVTKTLPFAFQNQLNSQSLFQGQTVQMLELDNQQQLNTLQQKALFSQLQQPAQNQPQFQQQQQQQQLHQPLPPVLQNVNMHLDLLASLSQDQELQRQRSPSVVIALGGHNYLGQLVQFNKSLQLTIIKDPQLNGQQLGSDLKLVSGPPQGQLSQKILPGPSTHNTCATPNVMLAQLVNQPVKTNMLTVDKLSGHPRVTAQQNTIQIVPNSKHTSSSSALIQIPAPIAASSSNTRIDAPPQQQQQQQTLLHQMQHLSQFPQQQQQDQSQQQQLATCSLAWPESVSEYTSEGDLSSLADVNQLDCFSTLLPGSSKTSWVLQLPASLMDQPTMSQLSHPRVVPVTLSAPGTGS